MGGDSELAAACGTSAQAGAAADGVYPMRLQRFLARAGVASRRGSENLMTAGRVTVNGRVVTELGSKVDPLRDEVAVDGAVVRWGSAPVTLMLHKPAGFLTTMDDPQRRPTVAELVPTERFPGLYPIGRLDGDTTGLLLFSTDGRLGHGLLHPSHHVSKSYLACVEGVPSPAALERLREGVLLEDGMTAPAGAELLDEEQAAQALTLLSLPDGPAAAGATASRKALSAWRRQNRSVVRLVLSEGRKHQVKRMLAAVGHPVLSLHRERFGPLSLEGLPPGEWRELTAEELCELEDALSKGVGGRAAVLE